MIETHQNPKICLISKFFILALLPLFPVCLSLILCYQLIKNGTGSTGTETSRFRFVGCVDIRSCLIFIVKTHQLNVDLSRKVVFTLTKCFCKNVGYSDSGCTYLGSLVNKQSRGKHLVCCGAVQGAKASKILSPMQG
jgi:hypothetical protein